MVIICKSINEDKRNMVHDLRATVCWFYSQLLGMLTLGYFYDLWAECVWMGVGRRVCAVGRGVCCGEGECAVRRGVQLRCSAVCEPIFVRTSPST